MISFEEALCGHYTNKAQATSDPQKWPWVNIEWTEIKKGKILECKSWYEYEGPNKPYKHFRAKIKRIHEDIIECDTLDLKKNKKGCGFDFVKMDDGTWWGETNGPCVVNDINITALARFNGTDYWSFDNGRRLRSGAFVWGKEEKDGEFHFKKLAK